MVSFPIPPEPSINRFKLSKFLGCDFTTDSTQLDPRRSDNAYNITNNNDYNEKRPGYADFLTIAGDLNINGIWNVDSMSDNIVVIHAGTKLYETTFPLPTEAPFYTEIYDGIADVITQKQGLVIDGKLLIFDGTEALVYYDNGSDFVVAKLTTVGTRPTTSINRNPDGSGAVSYEDPNIMSNSRTNSFVGDADSTAYYLDTLPDATPIVVGILQVSGSFAYTTEGVGTPGFTVDRSGTVGVINFGTAPGVTPSTGVDSVEVLFDTNLSAESAKINACDIVGTFGYDGNINRIFLAGNPDYPNIDWFSKEDDPLYFPSSNWTKIGLKTAPIMSYSNMGNVLAVNKELTDTDSTIYYRESALLRAQEVFPFKQGQKTIGTITKNCNDNVVDEPVILSDLGLYALQIVSDEVNDNKFAQLRSYYLNGKLLKEANLENAISIMLKEKYYLAINNHVYVLDTRYKSYEDDSISNSYQLEGYYWTNVPVRCWFKLDNELYFGTTDGRICKFDLDSYVDNATPVSSYWETPWLNINILSNYKDWVKTHVVCGKKKNETIKVGCIVKTKNKVLLDKAYDLDADVSYPRTLVSKKMVNKIMFRISSPAYTPLPG